MRVKDTMNKETMPKLAGKPTCFIHKGIKNYKEFITKQIYSFGHCYKLIKWPSASLFLLNEKYDTFYLFI